MSVLSVDQRLVKGQIACRSLRAWSKDERVILAIPGGPGLSGEYLEPFLASLAEATSHNATLVDLPNHGKSVLRPNGAVLDFRHCLDLLASAIDEIGPRAKGVVLFGQSLGARLSFDLAAMRGESVSAVVMTGLPYAFENSSALTKKLAAISFESLTGGPDDEAAFARNWSKVLPYYTSAPLPAEVAGRLTSGTKWRGNERMLDQAPPFDAVAASMEGRGAPPMLIIQGGQDLVVPEGNLATLRRSVPVAEFKEIADAGHFVMVEKPSETIRLIADFLGRNGGGT